MNMLKKQAESNKPYGAICASPALVFEPHGLLKVQTKRERNHNSIHIVKTQMRRIITILLFSMP